VLLAYFKTQSNTQTKSALIMTASEIFNWTLRHFDKYFLLIGQCSIWENKAYLWKYHDKLPLRRLCVLRPCAASKWIRSKDMKWWWQTISSEGICLKYGFCFCVSQCTSHHFFGSQVFHARGQINIDIGKAMRRRWPARWAKFHENCSVFYRSRLSKRIPKYFSRRTAVH
jgi:hypothetical protein